MHCPTYTIGDIGRRGAGGRSRGNLRTCNMAALTLIHRHMHQSPPLLSVLRATSFLCYQRSHSHHSSNQTLVYHAPASHLLLPSTPFHIDTVSIHSFHVAKPSQHSLVPSTRRPTFSPTILCASLSLTLSVRSCHSYHTFQTLHLQLMHFSSFSTSFRQLQ